MQTKTVFIGQMEQALIEKDTPLKDLRGKFLYLAIGLSGVAALIYEVVWSRALTNTIGSSLYSVSVLLAAFMAGLAIGSYYGGAYISDKSEPVKVFGALQIGIGVFGVATFYIINNFEPIYGQLFYGLRVSFAVFSLAQLVVVFLAMMIPTCFMGATFPVVVQAISKSLKEVGLDAGNIYSVNTWGAALGALAAGFLLIPIMGLTWSIILAACINLVLALLAFFLTSQSRALVLLFTPILLLPGVLLFIKPIQGIPFGYGVADHYSSYYEFQAMTAGYYESLYNKESPYGHVQVLTKGKYGSGFEKLVLVNGGRIEGGTAADVTNQKMLAYLPLAIKPRSESLLNIGLGTGMTVATAARNRGLNVIDDVEINPYIHEAVERYFFPSLFEDRRVNTIVDDARHYLLLTRRKYDVIISEPSYPTSKGEAHLYTREFYQIASEKMTKDGVFAQWLPRYLLGRDDLAIAVKTMASVFPNIYAWDIGSSDDIILVGLKSDRQLDASVINARIRSLKDKQLVGWRYSANAQDLAFVMQDPTVPLNLDDLPRIEFTSAHNKITGVQRENQRNSGLEER